MFISAVQWNESAIYIYVYVYIYPLPLWPPSLTPHPTDLGHHRAPSWVPCALQWLPTTIYFAHGSIFMSILISQSVPSLPQLSSSVCSLHLCLYSCPANRFISTIFFFFGFQIYALTHDICFSLTDLLHSVWQALCIHAKSFQSCSTLCDPMDYSLVGSSVHGILQVRILE